MIGYLRGTIEDVSENLVVVDVGGVGYNVNVSPNLAQRFSISMGEVKIFTYTYVKEDAFLLYGFEDKDELSLFKLLISVNGIGPKGAIGILSSISASELKFAIYAQDVKRISQAQGVGKKTAERLILDLKDKISVADTVDGAMSSLRGDESAGIGLENAERADAVSALVALGYSKTDAVKAVSKVDVSAVTSDEILKEALKYLF